MGVLDYVILGILGANALYGFLRGMVREALSLAVWVASYMVAARVYGFGAAYLGRVAGDPILAGGISFTTVFLVTTLVIGTLVGLIYRLTSRGSPSFPSRFIGSIFGFARGFLVVSVLLLFSNTFSERATQGDLLNSSPLAPYLDIMTESISLAFPTANHGSLDNRLTRELKDVRKNRGEGLLGNLAKAMESRQDPERLKETVKDLSLEELQ